MTSLGELSLWAAAPFLGLAAFAWVAGGWWGRRRLADLGGRSAEVGAALLLLSLLGLAQALLSVQLRYAYVARHSGFELGWPWRLTGLWSGPGGAALLLTFLLAAVAAAAYRLGPSRGSAGRSGGLAVLALFTLSIVARAGPFARPETPILAAEGLPLAMERVAWQIEVISVLTAVACAAFTFAGLLGSQLVESPGRERAERGAVVLAAGTLTLALMAAAWGAYTEGGRLLDIGGVVRVAVHVPAWLLAFAYLHAPGGLAAPAWAIRWRRITGVALFPAALGAAAALLAARGAVPPAVPWSGGLAVGIVSGAMAGMARGRGWSGGLESIPGFGPYAAVGGMILLTGAALAAAWGLVRWEVLGTVLWLLTLTGLAAAVAWSTGRAARRRSWIWPAVVAASVLGAVAIFLASGVTLLALSGGLAVGLLAGLSADLGRIGRVRRALKRPVKSPGLFRWRNERRWASAVAHLGIGLLAVGFAAEALRSSETQGLRPGAALTLEPRLGADLKLTYLGFSRYQVGRQDREVASFRLERGGGDGELVTVSSTYDWSIRRQVEIPAVEPGALRDVIVRLAGRGGGDAIVCQVSIRPLASLIWVGGFLLLVSTLARGRRAP